jgi:hypothetical protein
MNNKQQLELIKIKEDAILDEMEELKRLYDLDIIEEYRNFNNVFISSVKTLTQILRRTIVTQYINNDFVPTDKFCVNGEMVDEEMRNKLTKINTIIVDFINDMINKFTSKSKDLLQLRCNIKTDKLDYNGIMFPRYSKIYKYTQQIIDDYMKLLMD